MLVGKHTGPKPKSEQIAKIDPGMLISAHLARLMRGGRWAAKTRVWACLYLHSIVAGSFSETLMTIGEDNLRPLQSIHISFETGVARREVRRSLKELESEGWLRRVNSAICDFGNLNHIYRLDREDSSVRPVNSLKTQERPQVVQ